MNRRHFLMRSSAGSLAAFVSAAGPDRRSTAADTPPAAPAEKRDIVLGMSAAFTGPTRGLGIELYRGTMAYLEHVNRSGGIGGRKIAIKAYDDGYNPRPAIENTIRLIEKDDVLLLYGYVGTPTVTRILPLLKLHSHLSMHLLFPFTGAQPQREPPYGEYAYNLRASYRQETAGLVDRFWEIGRKRIAIFYQIDAYGRSIWEGVRIALARHGAKIAGEATFKRGTPFEHDLSPQVEILRKSQADAIICAGTYANCGAFIRDVKDAGWNVPIANISFVGSTRLLDLLIDTGRARGKDYTRNLINSEVVPSYDSELPAAREYGEMMDRYNPQLPADLPHEDCKLLPRSFAGFEGFLNAKLLVEIIRRMGKDIGREHLRKAVESVDRFPLGTGDTVSFGKGKHQGSDEIYFVTVEDGRFVPIADWKKWSP